MSVLYLVWVCFVLLIVVRMGRWSDDSACVVHDVRMYSVSDTEVIASEDVCCQGRI